MLVTVGGRHAGLIADTARARGVECLHVADADAARHAVQQVLRPGDVVLVKGSNGVGLQPVAATLAAVGAQSG